MESLHSPVRLATYFSQLYKDPVRSEGTSAMPEMTNVELPTVMLSEAAPTAKEILDAVKSKSNGAAPGLDSISYVPYKRCPCLLPILVQLFAKIWASKEVPADWATACIQLLAKSAKTSEPAEFRPIALTNTVGKIFFSVIAKRLENYMLANKFITHAQKGFKAETPGCLEHSFAMFEALLDAKHNQRQIVIAWLDLKNAYGSVRHNLIQFALSWFHVPLIIRQLILNYYDKICAQIRSKEWRTPFFVFDIGLFQGCVLSCILFNCVFQLLLNLVARLSSANGYKFKEIPVVLHDQAFADDISITSSTPQLAQQSIDVIVKFLEWYHLQANPKKCITMAMKKFDARNEHEVEFERHGETVYCPYNPNLTIAGTKLRFIVDVAADTSSLQYDHFKELGRFISVDLKEDKIKTEIRRRLNADMDAIDGCGLPGPCKLFLYEHFAVRRLSWVFLVHDLNLWFSKELEKRIMMRLKTWAGLYRGSDTGTLFRRREHLGLQLTSIVDHFERMQLVKCCLLANSKDSNVSTIYEAKRERQAGFSKRWSATQELSHLEPEVDRDIRFPAHTGRAGLGFGLHIADPTVAEYRSKVTETFAKECEADRVRHASCLARQGVWTKWNVRPFDLSWENLIYGPGPRVIAFVLNAQINSVCTPDMLKLWGYIDFATCALCGGKQCTLHHLLVNCPFALNQGRYTWRHDSVLQDIERALQNLIPTFNAKTPTIFAEVAKKDFKSCFVRAGQRKKPLNKSQERRCLLDFANDWKLQVDFKDRKLVFPPAICSTDLRPDAVIWSALSRTVILLELTCCAEEGIEGAQIRKEARYAELLKQIEEQKWTVTLLTLEIGARGLVGSRTFRSFVVLGFSVRSANTLCKSLSDIASRCSYGIYLAHSTTVWPHNNDLVVGRSARPQADEQPLTFAQQKLEPNIVTLRKNGIKKLYHFTDASNVASIKQHGLMSASNLIASAISSAMNSDEVSRSLDASANLENFVRLSFCAKNPMMYVAYKEGRISKPTLLEIKLEVVSRPGVQFTDSNATRLDARHSTNPNIVRFDVVKAKTLYDVAPELRRFYQAEILVPSPLPAHLITVRRSPVRISKQATLELSAFANGCDPATMEHKAAPAKNASAEGGDLSVSGLTNTSTAKHEARRSSKSSSTPVCVSTSTPASSTACNVSLAEGGAATSSTSPPVHVLGSPATGLVAKFNSADALATNAQPWVSCCGIEHEPQDYCSCASVETWVRRREPVTPCANARRTALTPSPCVHRSTARNTRTKRPAKPATAVNLGASVQSESRTAQCLTLKPNALVAPAQNVERSPNVATTCSSASAPEQARTARSVKPVPVAAAVSPSAGAPDQARTARREEKSTVCSSASVPDQAPPSVKPVPVPVAAAVSPSASVPSSARTARREEKSTVCSSVSAPSTTRTARSVKTVPVAAAVSPSASVPSSARTARSVKTVPVAAAVSPSASVPSSARTARGVEKSTACSSASVPDQTRTARSMYVKPVPVAAMSEPSEACTARTAPAVGTMRRSSQNSHAVTMSAGSLTTLCTATTMTVTSRVSGAKLKTAAVNLKSPSASKRNVVPAARRAARSIEFSVDSKEVTQHATESTNALTTNSRARYTNPQGPQRRRSDSICPRTLEA